MFEGLDKFLSPAALAFLILGAGLVLALSSVVQHVVAFHKQRWGLSSRGTVVLSLVASGLLNALALWPGVLQSGDGVALFPPVISWLILTGATFYRASGGWDLQQQQKGE